MSAGSFYVAVYPDGVFTGHCRDDALARTTWPTACTILRYTQRVGDGTAEVIADRHTARRLVAVRDPETGS